MAVRQQRTSYAPVNRCIYCFRNERNRGVQLTKEHIIAKGLNGNSVLPRASCGDCAKTTSRIERAFLRGPAWPLRAFLQTSTKKRFPEAFDLISWKAGCSERVRVPLQQYPLLLPMPVFQPIPQVVHGEGPLGLVKGIVCDLGGGRERLDALRLQLGADRLELPGLDVIAFCRLLAKSAYALCVAELGLSSVGETNLARAILSEDHDICRFIGSGGNSALTPELAWHSTQVMRFIRPEGDACNVVLLKLFAQLVVPGYVVCVV